MIVIKQLRQVIRKLAEKGETWKEIGDLFNHSANWAYDWGNRKKEQLIVDERLIAGLNRLGYDIRIVKIREGAKDG